jgi:hypothetical protein
VCSSEFSATIILALNYTNAFQNTQQVLQSFLDFFLSLLYPVDCTAELPAMM